MYVDCQDQEVLLLVLPMSEETRSGEDTSTTKTVMDEEEDHDDTTRLEEMMLLVPTPISADGIRVVEEVPRIQRSWAQDPNFFACLQPFLVLEGVPPKQHEFEQRRSKEKEHQQQSPLRNAGGQQSCPSNANVDLLLRAEEQQESGFYRSSTSRTPCCPHGGGEPRINATQTGMWNRRYNELKEFQQLHGHCIVPYDYKLNTKLALWVKRQRHQYKLLREEKRSTMTPDRKEALERLGFVWDSQKASWEERLNDLLDFREKHGHCNVPASFQDNQRLSTWVKCQRRQYRLFRNGKRSHMTPERLTKLTGCGLSWDLKSRKQS